MKTNKRANNLVRSGNQLKDTNDAKGIYRARVEAVDDPLGVGRVRVRVPKFHGLENKEGLGKERLPWAAMVSQSAGYNYGSFIVPEVGEYVLVQFEDEDPYKPVYLGSLYGSGSRKPKKYESDEEEWESEPEIPETPEDAQGRESTKKILYKSRNGAEVSIEEHFGEEMLEIKDAVGQSITMSCPEASNLESGEGNEDRDLTISAYGGQSVAMHSGADGSTSINISLEDGDGVFISDEDGISINRGNACITIDNEGNISICGSKVDIFANDGINIETPGHINIHGSSVDIGDNVTINEGTGGGEGAFDGDVDKWEEPELTPEEEAIVDGIVGEYGLENFLSNFLLQQGDYQSATQKGLCCFTSYCMVGGYLNGQKLSNSQIRSLLSKYVTSSKGNTNTPGLAAALGINKTSTVTGSQKIMNTIKEATNIGNPSILKVSGYWGKGGEYHATSNDHFMVVTGCNDTGIKVADPNGKSGNNSRTIPWSALNEKAVKELRTFEKS